MRVFGVTGRSDGATVELTARVVAALRQRGLRVSAISCLNDAAVIDKPGKDSYRHREAGATEVMVASAGRWSLIHDQQGAPGPTITEVLAHMTPVDLVLAAGLEETGYPRLEVHRTADGAPPSRRDPDVVALAGDAPPIDLDVPVFALDDATGIADFIVRHVDVEVG